MATSDPLFARFGRTVEPGDTLFREGEQGNCMYVLQSGSIRISKEVKGEAKTLGILRAGDFFGEMAILNNKPRTATAVVEERAHLLVLGAKTFEQMVVSNSEIAVRMIKKLSRRLDSANELIEVLMHRDPKARVILGLSREADFTGVKRPDGSILVPLDVAGLAKQVGLALDVTQEVVKRLSRLKILTVESGGLAVLDAHRLEEFYEFLEMREKFGDA